MVVCQGVEGHILVNNAALKEYDDDENEDTPNSVAKYIEAVSDASFTIEYAFTETLKPKHDVVVWVSLDSQSRLTGACVRRADLHSKKRVLENFRSRKGTKYYQQDFGFAPIRIGKLMQITLTHHF